MRFLAIENLDDEQTPIDPSEVSSFSSTHWDQSEDSAFIGEGYVAVADALGTADAIEKIQSQGNAYSDAESGVVETAIECLLAQIGKRNANINVSNEGLKQTIKDIIAKVIAFFKRIFEAVKSWFVGAEKTIEKHGEAAQHFKEEIKKQEHVIKMMAEEVDDPRMFKKYGRNIDNSITDIGDDSQVQKTSSQSKAPPQKEAPKHEHAHTAPNGTEEKLEWFTILISSKYKDLFRKNLDIKGDNLDAILSSLSVFGTQFIPSELIKRAKQQFENLEDSLRNLNSSSSEIIDMVSANIGDPGKYKGDLIKELMRISVSGIGGMLHLKGDRKVILKGFLLSELVYVGYDLDPPGDGDEEDMQRAIKTLRSMKMVVEKYNKHDKSEVQEISIMFNRKNFAQEIHEVAELYVKMTEMAKVVESKCRKSQEENQMKLDTFAERGGRAGDEYAPFINAVLHAHTEITKARIEFSRKAVAESILVLEMINHICKQTPAHVKS